MAESIYPHVTGLYNYEPPGKTHIIFLDTDDFSNGIAYAYDNKIEIWTSPLEFELRGSHRWLQNVMTHEFTHIVSIQKAMRFGMNIPAAYLQWIGYEKEKREDVLYGYPRTLVSYPIPGSIVPPWLAEGIAQYMFEGATHDFWDTHRDMILRDRILNGDLLTLTEMSTFGKTGIGNESAYNSGFALARFIVFKYGEGALAKIIENLSSPFGFSVDSAIKKAMGISSEELYSDFEQTLEQRYGLLTEGIKSNELKGRIIVREGTTNIHPVWAPDGERFAYLSNRDNDFFSQTDLFVYSLAEGRSEKIAKGVVSAPTWKLSGDVIYYSKKSRHNRQGSRWFDIYEYSFGKEKENRLTKGLRSFSAVMLPGDSLLAYLAVKDGTHNVFLINLNSEESEQITGFDDGRQLFGLAYDPTNSWLIFDYLENHFRNTATLHLKDSTFSNLFATTEWDERDVAVAPDGGLVYADDRSGVFNLNYVNPLTGEQGFVTNVLGGAFMPDVNADGNVVFSLYEDGGYRIAIIDSLQFIASDVVGYGPDYFTRFANLPGPMKESNDSEANSYGDTFTRMFLFPKIMIDYGTVKPGFYFYSDEILNKLNVFGGASINLTQDSDLFLLFEFRKFYPTVYTEIFHLTRNVSESTEYIVYDLDYDLKFRLFQWDAGIKFPILGVNEIKIYGSYQNFREAIKERVEGQFGKIGFDYYIGKHAGINWTTEVSRATVDGDINPSNGFSVNIDLRRERDDFLSGFKINEDYSTLQPDYTEYDFWRLRAGAKVHFTIPRTDKWTTTLHLQTGWMSRTDVDSFFYFFGGGMPGIKGYPFYSIEGSRMAIASLFFRIPLIRERHIPLGPFILQNINLGLVGQIGDAWIGTVSPKRSVGFQMRFGGFSFYNYPTGIAVEFHRGMDKFTSLDEQYGRDVRTYFTLLFGF